MLSITQAKGHAFKSKGAYGASEGCLFLVF